MRTVQTPDREFQALRFGRKSNHAATAIVARSSLAGDIRLFALTFAGGFLFMAVYLG